jgi:TldD protein
MNIIILLAGICFAQNIDNDVLLKAMVDELNVSYEKLKNAQEHQLYFIGYEAWVNDNYFLSSKLGAVLNEDEDKTSYLTCDIRIGTPSLDSTHEIKTTDRQQYYKNNSSRQNIVLVSLNDYDAIRTQIWNITDETYKSALNRYIKVISNKNITAEEEDKSGDFITNVKYDVFYSTTTKENIDKEKIKNFMKEISVYFKKYDFIIDSEVGFLAKNFSRYIVNSDGARIVEGARKYRLYYYITSRTDDGLDLSRFNSYEFENINEIPSKEKIISDMDVSVRELKELLNAPNLEPYSGPVIMEAKASGVFWHEIFGHRAEGHRQKIEQSGQTFAKKIGEKIMPDFLSIYDDPNLKYYKGRFLNGYYLYDDEGVKSQKAELVDKGVLKGFLMQRVPVRGFNQSNGHGRRSPGYITVARQGNLILESSKTVSYEELKKMLIDEVKKSGKEYGLIIKDIEGGYTITTRDLPQSYSILVKYAVKIYPDGKEVPVRGFNIVGTPLNTFPNIIATANDFDVFNGMCGAESGWVDVSGVSPSILFKTMETEKVQKSNQKPPVLKPPFFDKD